jgi:hypothetical protein
VKKNKLEKIYNKNFWEELIAYFYWNNADRIENDESNGSFILTCIFVAAVKFVLSRCLVRMRETHTDTQIDGRDLRSAKTARHLPGGKGRSTSKADNLYAICEPIV